MKPYVDKDDRNSTFKHKDTMRKVSKHRRPHKKAYRMMLNKQTQEEIKE